MTDLNKLNVVEAHKGLVEKKFSSEEILNDCLAVIDERDKEINAFVTVDRDGARESAREVDAKIAAGEQIPVLAGLPVAVKDIFNVKGIKNTCCSPIMKDFVSPYDATVIEKLKANGMVMIGKTNTDEFACGASTESSCFGVTKNPYDLGRVAGGSSGGSAAALAADMALYSLGSDTGGSIRQPAAFCDVYGMKVTYGRVSRSGITSMASSWDTIGTFAKGPEDVAHILNVMAGRDRRDSTSSSTEVPDYTTFINNGVKGLKIGIAKQYFSEGVEKETIDKIMEQVKKLENAGAEILNVDLPYTKYAVAVYYITMPAELSANLERFDGIRYGKKPDEDVNDIVDYYFKARGKGFGAEIKRRIMMGTYVLSAGYYDAYYKRAQRVRTLILKDFENAFKSVDVMIAPVSPFPAFKIGQFADDPLKMYMADALTIPSSAAGLPSLACPAGMSADGLPIGLQIIGAQFDEGRLLNVASVLSSIN